MGSDKNQCNVPELLNVSNGLHAAGLLLGVQEELAMSGFERGVGEEWKQLKKNDDPSLSYRSAFLFQ